MTLNVVTLDDVAAQPWRNGGGATRELLKWPNADDWTLRLSVADIEKDGPFSAFPGVQRWIVALTGVGMELGEPFDFRIEPGMPPYRFQGDYAPTCTLIDGPTTDLNLMINERHASGWLRRIVSDNASTENGLWLTTCEPQCADLCGVFTWAGITLRTRRSGVIVPPRSLVWSQNDVREWRISDITGCWGFQCFLSAAPKGAM